MKYYVNTGNLIGKVFEASTDLEAVSRAVGYGYAKNWHTVNVYCQTTRETVTREFPTFPPKRWFTVVQFMPDFIATDKPLWN